MADLKLYDKLDLAPLREYFMNHGERRLYRARQHFITIGRTATEMGLVVSGGFAFSHPDYKGDRQILTLAFAGELVGNYITPIFQVAPATTPPPCANPKSLSYLIPTS